MFRLSEMLWTTQVSWPICFVEYECEGKEVRSGIDESSITNIERILNIYLLYV
jgi:hypothetical protein